MAVDFVNGFYIIIHGSTLYMSIDHLRQPYDNVLRLKMNGQAYHGWKYIAHFTLYIIYDSLYGLKIELPA